MIRKISKKMTSMIMAITMVLSYVIPINVFAETIDPSVTANITLTNGNTFMGDFSVAKDEQDEDNDATTTYKLYIQADFGSVIAQDGISVNGIMYPVPGGNEEETIYLPTPVGNHFDIDVTYEDGFAPNMMPNIVWTYSEKTCNEKGFVGPDQKCDALIEHGKIEIVQIKNDNGVLTADQLKEKDENGDPKWQDGSIDEQDDFVWADIEADSEVTIRLIPDYGYQLTKLQVNDTVFKAANEQSTYTFKMAEGALHLSALFTKVDDVVKSSTSKVKNGSIKIGSSEITSGSTVLSVKDATLTDEQKSTFITKAGDYKVSNVFDIKLDQVVYKGKADDVWTKPLGYSEDLKTPAVITLSLDEGVDGNTVVLIHEKEDGTYETIETTYDETTHTISFLTSSFSNYAIASKTVATEEPKEEPKDEIENPQTYDGLISWIVLSVISLSGIVGIITYRKKQNI